MSELRVLLVTPLSGPLARFGRAGAVALRLWAAQAAELPAGWRSVRLDLRDACPDPAAAMRSGLVAQPHVVLGPYGSHLALKGLAASQGVVWNHGGASSRIRWPAFPQTVNVLAPASTYFRGTLEAVRRVDREAGKVVILHSTTGFGSDVAHGAAQAAARLDFEAARIGFSPGEAARAARRLPAAEVLLVAGGFEDELAAAAALPEGDWRAVAFVGAGVEDVLAPLGAAREGLLGPTQWMASAATQIDEGPELAWFLTRYRAAVGGDPPYPACQAFAAGVLAARCLREARTLEDRALLAVARELVCRTLYGAFRLDPASGLQAGHEVLTVQWQGGARRIVWPPRHAEQPLLYPRPRR